MSQNQYWFDHQEDPDLEANEGWRTHNGSHPYENENGKKWRITTEARATHRKWFQMVIAPLYTPPNTKLVQVITNAEICLNLSHIFCLSVVLFLKKLLGVKECFSPSDLKLGIVIVMAMDGHVKCLLCTSLKV